MFLFDLKSDPLAKFYYCASDCGLASCKGTSSVYFYSVFCIDEIYTGPTHTSINDNNRGTIR